MGKTINPPIPEIFGEAILFEQQIDYIIQEAKQADSKPQNVESKNKNGLLIEKGAINKASLIVEEKDKTTPVAKDVSYDHEPVNNRSMMPDGRFGNGLSYEHESAVNTPSGANGKDNSSSSANNSLLHEHATLDDKQKTVQSKSKTSSSRKHDNLIYEHGPVNNKYKSRAVNNKNRKDLSTYDKNSRNKSKAVETKKKERTKIFSRENNNIKDKSGVSKAKRPQTDSRKKVEKKQNHSK